MKKSKKIDITYKFQFPREEIVHNASIDLNKLLLLPTSTGKKYDWMKLSFFKCNICPLKEKEHPYCPLALATSEVILSFSEHHSYDRVRVLVDTPERSYSKECDLQKGISSLLGLLMATSGCPFFTDLKAVARFHLPFASLEETVYRVSCSYLLGEYFNNRQKPDFSFKKLLKMYENIEIVNEDFLRRLHEATEVDSSLNAIVTLDIFAKSLPVSIARELEDLRYLFSL